MDLAPVPDLAPAPAWALDRVPVLVRDRSPVRAPVQADPSADRAPAALSAEDAQVPAPGPEVLSEADGLWVALVPAALLEAGAPLAEAGGPEEAVLEADGPAAAPSGEAEAVGADSPVGFSPTVDVTD